MTLTVYRPVSGRVEVSVMRAPREDEPTNRERFKDETGKAIRPLWAEGPRGWDGHWALARQHFMTVARPEPWLSASARSSSSWRWLNEASPPLPDSAPRTRQAGCCCGPIALSTPTQS